MESATAHNQAVTDAARLHASPDLLQRIGMQRVAAEVRNALQIAASAVDEVEAFGPSAELLDEMRGAIERIGRIADALDGRGV